MKKQWMQLGLFAVWGFSVQAAVVVENVSVGQVEGSKLVEISYDVSSTLSGTVEVSLLLFDGATPISLSSLSGDVGAGVATGAGKTVFWDAGADWNGQVRSCLQLWIVADDGTDSSPVPDSGSKLVLADSNSGTDPDFGSYAVALSGNLLVDAVEVDSNLWTTVYDWAVANGYDFDNAGNALSNNHPVVAINWYDAVKWCNARSEKEGFAPIYEVGGAVYRTGDSIPTSMVADGYRLPTVAEWQYMARGCRTGSRFPWGDTITHSNANYYSVASSYDVSPTRGYHPDYAANWPGTSPGGVFAANGLGLYDMAGNVWEWCWDAAPEGRYLVGGSWQDAAPSARCGATLGDAPGNSRFNAGFRTVRQTSVSSAANAAVDTRDYTLSVSPNLGNPQPGVGVHIYAWRSTVACSVDSTATDGGTNFTLLGWTGTGSILASGSTNATGSIVLDNPESSIVWNWEAHLMDGDSDGDTIPDAWELAYSGSITGLLASADSDGDQQSNIAEYIAGTDPTNSASLFQVESHPETSGFVIEWTAVTGRVYSVLWTPSLGQDFQPLETGIHYPQDSYTDTVHSAESGGFYRVVVVLESYDADGDGMPNDWESQYAVADAQTDADGDGVSNLMEYIAGTNPTNGASFFTTSISLVETNGASYFVVEWNAIPGRIYKVRWRVSLMEDYQLLADGIEYPQNSYTNMLDTGTGFYRVDVRLK